MNSTPRAVIEQLKKNGYLHRDVSINNVVLAIGDKDLPIDEELRRRLEGFLIDFDYSLLINNSDPSALAQRTVRAIRF